MMDMWEKVARGRGFFAALDQSGGSTPAALRRYGVPDDAWGDEATMFDLVHAMRTRIVTSPAFGGDRVIAAILFEQTMDRTVDGTGFAEYLWQHKGVVPFVKIDQGLADEEDGVRLMRPMPGLDALLDRAQTHGVLGTKMRSLVRRADPVGIEAVVEQQFRAARTVLEAGMLPIVEPEVDILSPDKAAAEHLLQHALLRHLDALDAGRAVVLKLTLPELDDGHVPLLEHPRVLRVAALSGGYARIEAVARLERQHGVVASFSRALTEGLRADMTDEEFDTALDASIGAVYAASLT
ncbi:fructose bisphosphate aldolase [Phycicoccus sp.]|uniref:fructose bisphosphate aldolase n=1 Tax=Phycicoccus sp. TaxID=1902410 RepID=UPI0032C2401C